MSRYPENDRGHIGDRFSVRHAGGRACGAGCSRRMLEPNWISERFSRRDRGKSSAKSFGTACEGLCGVEISQAALRRIVEIFKQIRIRMSLLLILMCVCTSPGCDSENATVQTIPEAVAVPRVSSPEAGATHMLENADSWPAAKGPAAGNVLAYPDLSDSFYLAEQPSVYTTPTAVPPDPNLKNRVEHLIWQLTSTERPGPGFNPSSTGSSFILAPEGSQPSAFMIGRFADTVPDAMRELVEIGPAAMDGLLAHLDDQRPTKLIVEHKGGFGGMETSNYLDFNPLNTREQRILLQSTVPNSSGFETRHVVTVGDLCFVVLGQIVGRQYEAVSYMPTACILLGCPTKSPALCSQLRQIWTSEDYYQSLWSSLVTDFATRGKPHEDRDEEVGRWYRATDLQISAAVRLLYYYPDEGARIVAIRLDNLDVSACATGEFGMEKAAEDAYRLVSRRNGLRLDFLIQAVCANKHPSIVEALDRIKARSDNPEILRLLGDQRDQAVPK